MENKTVLGILVAFLLIGFIVQGAMVVSKFSSDGVTQEQVQQVVREEVAKIVIPAQPVPVIPTAAEIAAEMTIENADNALLNEFLESNFEDQYEFLETEVNIVALDEMDYRNYRVIKDYVMSLSEGIDEDRLDEYLETLDVDEFEIKVTALGLGESDEASARITYEFEVEYEFEEGVIGERYHKDIEVAYDVVFEEVDYDSKKFGDEEVTLVSIV